MTPSQRHVADRSLARLTANVEGAFLKQFGCPPSIVVAAPGRVNLIGEHIDYNDGLVLPLAIERYVVIAAAPPKVEPLHPSIHMHSRDLRDTEIIRTDRSIQPGRPGWVRYVEGVIAGFLELGEEIPSLDAMIGSNVPIGGGLSSSAALEVATATLLEQSTGRTLDRAEKALLCQTAEHRFAGVPCGIMDQFSSVFGRPDELMLIDCRSQRVEAVPFGSPEISVLITNSNVKHELTGGEYGQRRSQSDAALSKLNQETWRTVTIDQLEQCRVSLSEIEFRRARHVVTEIRRTISAAEAIRKCDWETAGRLMNASHDSLRDDYQVSCAELDVLVDIALSIGKPNGVLGSRMTGGGFGGCTVSLVRTEKLESIIASLSAQYELATGIRPTSFASRPARGAHVIKEALGTPE